MAQQGYNNPGTQTDDSTVGTVPITNIANIASQDATDATAALSTSSSVAVVDNSLKLYDGTAFVGTDQSSTTHWSVTPSPEETFTYGSSTNMMGSSLTPTQVRASGFGVGISVKMASGAGTASHYFRGTNYGFTPVGVMSGFEVQVTHYNQGGITSFVGGTQVLMSNLTYKPIEWVQVGDSVLSFFRGKFYPSRVTATRQGQRGVIRVETTEGEVVATADHRFYMGQGKYKKAININIGEALYVMKSGLLVPALLVSKKTTASDNAMQTQQVYSLEVEKYHNFFANGFAVHNGIINSQTVVHVDWVGIRITFAPGSPTSLPCLGVG